MHMNCPVCASEQSRVFYSVHHVPVHQHLLYATPDEARHTRRGDIDLHVCEMCGFVWNGSFDASLLDYSEKYDNTQSFSALFNQYVEDEAQQLVSRYGLYKKRIIEIGCGKGDFIRRLCEIGDNTGVGFDPSYIGADTQLEGRLSFIREFYTPKFAHIQADLYCSRHVIEHVPEPTVLLHHIRNSIEGNHRPAIFFETPDVRWVFQQAAFWDIFYEHCSLFNPVSLAHLLKVCGFETTHTTSVFGDQYMWVEGLPASVDLGKTYPQNAEAVVREAFRFADLCEAKIKQTRETICHIQDTGKTMIVWGAGAKGVTFLNTLQPDAISYVVDMNPRKQGKYLAGTAQQIIAPEALSDIRPDVILIMNPNYQTEIRASLERIGYRCELLVI